MFHQKNPGIFFTITYLLCHRKNLENANIINYMICTKEKSNFLYVKKQYFKQKNLLYKNH